MGPLQSCQGYILQASPLTGFHRSQGLISTVKLVLEKKSYVAGGTWGSGFVGRFGVQGSCFPKDLLLNAQQRQVCGMFFVQNEFCSMQQQ